MKYLVILLTFLSSILFSQEKIQKEVDKPAQPVGGKLDVDYVFESQVIYPVNLLKKKASADVAIYFTVLADGSVKDIEFKNDYKEEFKNEAKRLLRYFIFTPSTIGNVSVASQSFLVFKFNPDTYKKYTKKRGFVIHKERASFDTSFVVYKMADSSPEYYKGEEALGEFILSNLEYPDLAIRQNLQGTVIMSFIVEPNGTLSNLVAEKEFNHFCTQEALRIMRETKWKPGKKDGKAIRYRTKYPIVFSLKNINKDNATSEQR
ncbi:MAG: energy transducer TonB [Bacteroidota bacterium]